MRDNKQQAIDSIVEMEGVKCVVSSHCSCGKKLGDEFEVRLEGNFKRDELRKIVYHLDLIHVLEGE